MLKCASYFEVNKSVVFQLPSVHCHLRASQRRNRSYFQENGFQWVRAKNQRCWEILIHEEGNTDESVRNLKGGLFFIFYFFYNRYSTLLNCRPHIPLFRGMLGSNPGLFGTLPLTFSTPATCAAMAAPAPQPIRISGRSPLVCLISRTFIIKKET